MALPLLMAGAAALGSIYSVGKAYDNVRYWNDYRKSTGFSPKYPFRSGEFDYLRNGASVGFSYGALKNLGRPRRISYHSHYHYHYRR